MMMSMLIPKPPTNLNIPTARGGGGLHHHMQLLCRHQQQVTEKVVVVMGATGTGKSRLSIDLATRFPGEIINSDKMQIHKGLDIVTNKITEEESGGVPHHLLSIVDPTAHFTASNFCNLATAAIKSILRRGKLPIIAGGSNSFIEALVDDKRSKFRSRYQCCFLWVDVSMQVLHPFLSERVDRMVKRGMVDEVRKMYNPDSDYSEGIRRSIGVPEFDRYLRLDDNSDVETRAKLLEEAINETKFNTCELACRQRDKINRLRTGKGWKIHRIDATEVFRKSGEEADKAWENLVVGPTSVIVSQFLENESVYTNWDAMAVRDPMIDRVLPSVADAATTH